MRTQDGTRLLRASQVPLVDICRRYGVKQLELFGSAATGEFEPGRSDLDFIVEFRDDFDYEGGLFTRYFGLKEELESLLELPVDLVMARAVRNPYFLESVNHSRRTVYAAH